MLTILFINSIYLKKTKKRLKILADFYKDKITPKFLSQKNLNRIFYYSR